MIQHLATLSLTIHPLVEHLPVRTPEHPEFQALMRTIGSEIGISTPLKISKGRIVDGRECWLAARKLGKETVPCIEIPEADVIATVLVGLCSHKVYTRGALAYLAFPFLEGALAESKKRRLDNLRKSVKSPQVVENVDSAAAALSVPKTAEDIAESYSIHRRDLFSARNIHGHFDKDEEMRAHFEPLILSGELGLGAVLQGIAGWASTKGKDKGEREQLLLWQDKIRGFCDPRKFAGWDKADPETKAWVRKELIKGIEAAWPQDLRHAILAELTEGAV